MTMEEYIQYETENALRNNQVYNWETAKYVNWKTKTSLSEYDDGKYNATSENILGIDKDLFSYDIFSIDNLKLEKDDDEGKIGFPAQSVGSSNTDVFDSPCLLVLITGTSQSRQHELFKVDSGRISIRHYEY
uniref:Uncharacterized protein n=1 Tax=Tanacetum cinerariifolium TaxID=118510 RepID=A0A6L2JUF8_TANCI|nr:hypothetical protein [Tanacetum cinerariifolium]